MSIPSDLQGANQTRRTNSQKVGVGMLQYEIKPATTHVSLVTGWLLTIGGIIGLVLPILPGLPSLLLGLAILSKRYG